MSTFSSKFEEIKVLGEELVDKIRDLIHEGNVRRVIIKDEKGHTFMEIPIGLAAIGAIAAPVLAAVGAISVMISKFTVVVEKVADPAPPEAPKTAPEPPPAV